MPPEVSFRLNGPLLRWSSLTAREYRESSRVDGKSRCGLTQGRFVIDNEMNLWDLTFPPHLLEYRNETQWTNSLLWSARTVRTTAAAGHTHRAGKGVAPRRRDELPVGVATNHQLGAT